MAWPYQRTNVIANDVEAKREAMRGLGRGRRRAGDGAAAAAARRGQGGVIEVAVEKCTRVSRQTGCAMAWPNGGSGRAGRRRRSSGGGRQRVEEEGEGRCLYGGSLWHRVIKSPGT